MNRLGYPFEEQRLGARLGLASGIRPIQWLLRDEFTTDDAAPVASPRTCEPGPGTLTITDTGNKLVITGGRLRISGASGTNWTDPTASSPASLVRLTGRTVFTSLLASAATALSLAGWRSSQSGGTASIKQALNLSSGSQISWWNGSSGILLSPSWSAGTPYPHAIVLRSVGAFAFLKISNVWTLLWIDLSENTSPLFPSLDWTGVLGQTIDADYFRVRDLPAPFTTDYGIATNHITSFTQSAGAELLTNGNFAAWTADNPDNWTVSGEVASDPMVTQVAPGGGAGTGAARLFSSATASAPQILQNVLSASAWYEISVKVDTRVSGTIEVSSGNSSFANLYNTTGVKSFIVKNGASTGFRIRNNVTTPLDITVDDASVKLLTLNAQVTMDANSIIDFAFTLPGSPVAGMRVELRYRIVDDTSYWVLYLQRNDANSAWDLRLDSVSSGTATNRINVTGVGTPDTIRVICDGSNHDVYSKAVATWTKRGGQIVNATHSTATGLNTVYSTGTTPTSLISYKRSNSVYAELDRTA